MIELIIGLVLLSVLWSIGAPLLLVLFGASIHLFLLLVELCESVVPVLLVVAIVVFICTL